MLNPNSFERVRASAKVNFTLCVRRFGQLGWPSGMIRSSRVSSALCSGTERTHLEATAFRWVTWVIFAFNDYGHSLQVSSALCSGAERFIIDCNSVDGYIKLPSNWFYPVVDSTSTGRSGIYSLYPGVVLHTGSKITRWAYNTGYRFRVSSN